MEPAKATNGKHPRGRSSTFGVPGCLAVFHGKMFICFLVPTGFGTATAELLFPSQGGDVSLRAPGCAAVHHLVPKPARQIQRFKWAVGTPHREHPTIIVLVVQYPGKDCHGSPKEVPLHIECACVFAPWFPCPCLGSIQGREIGLRALVSCKRAKASSFNFMTLLQNQTCRSQPRVDMIGVHVY